jgi:hypothetical protein
VKALSGEQLPTTGTTMVPTAAEEAEAAHGTRDASRTPLEGTSPVAKVYNVPIGIDQDVEDSPCV